jgi:hypothetical protein
MGKGEVMRGVSCSEVGGKVGKFWGSFDDAEMEPR